jgi:RNA polymerase sigma-70 factor (sigma-E family)
VSIVSTVADVSTFEQFFREQYSSIVALCAWLTGDRSAGEDLAQEAFGAVHRRWDEVARLDRPGAYARRVAINLSSNERRRRGRERRAVARLTPADTSDVAAGAHLRTVETRAPLWAAVAALPVQQRAAVGLRYLEDLSTDEIATVLDCAPATVRVHLHRAHRRLAERLGCSTDEDQEDLR